ncbi:MAG: hypothetical protein ACKPI8_15135 [Microcystis panniformis]
MWRFLSIVFALERTNQLSLLPDKDLVDLCPPIEPYQVTKNLKYISTVIYKRLLDTEYSADFFTGFTFERHLHLY